MATLAEIQRAYENAQRVGNTEAAQAIAQILQRASQPQTPKESTREKLLRQYEEAGQRAQPIQARDDGFLSNIASGFGAGAVGTGELAALGAASLFEEEKELAARQRIQDVAGAIRPEGGDPDSIAYKLASGLGSIAGIAAPAFLAAAAPVSAPVAGALGLGGAAALGIGAGAGEASERARAADATEEERSAATLRGAAIGSLEVTPLGRIFRRLPKIGELFAKGGDEVKENVGTLRKLFQEPRTALGRTGRTGVEEGIQEAAAGILQNLNERGYNVERELVDAGVVEEGAIGAGSGAILQGIVELFTRGKSRGAPRTEEEPATEEEIVEEQQLLALPAPTRPDELVEVRMPDGSVQKIPYQVIEEARRKEREARETATQQKQEKEDKEAKEVERRGSARVPTELLDERLTADMSPEQRARVRAQDEQIDAFTAERQAEQSKVDRKERQDKRAATKLGLRGDRIEEQLEIPGSETEVQREMFGRKRVKGKTQVRGPDGTMQEVPSEEPTVKRQKVAPESERLMSRPKPASEQQEMRLEQPRAERKQIEQPLIGPKGGIPRRQKAPFKSAPITQEPAPQADVLTNERLDTLGIAPSMQSVFVNKDVNKPETQRRLRNFTKNKRGSAQARANVTRLLDGISERQTDLFSETGPRVKSEQAPSGDGVSTVVSDVVPKSGVSSEGAGAEAVVAPEAGRVAGTGRSTGESVRGAVVEQPALSELDQQLLDVIENKEKPLNEKDFDTLRGRLTLNVYGDVDQRVTDAFTKESERRRQAKEKAPAQAKKPTAPKQVTRKATTPAAPAKEKRKSRTVAGVVKRGALSRPKTFEVPTDPVPDADVDKVEARLKKTTSREKDRSKTDENAALEAYFGRDERVIDALDRAIHDVVDKSSRFTAQKGVSEETIAYFAQSSAKNAEQVLAWAKKNLSKETNQWVEKRIETKKQALQRVTKRTKEVLAAEVKEAESPSELKAQSKKTTQRVIRDYVDDAAYASKEASREQRELDAEIKAIEEFFDDLPYELRTDDVMLGNELHPVTTSLLREGKLGEALRVLASLTPENRVRQLANKLADNVGNTKVEFFSDTKEGSLAGGFDPQTNTIKLNEAYGASQHTLLHEMVHAVASATLAKPSHPLTKQLNTLFNDVKDSLGTAYGAKNLDEFVSEAMSNPEFRAELAGINPDGSNINALQRFLGSVGNFLRRLVGMQTKDIESAQTRADALIDEILAPAPEFRDADTLAMSSTAASVKKVMGMFGDVQKKFSTPPNSKERKEFGELVEDTMDSLGSKAGFVVPKVLDLVALTDAINMVSKPLGAISQKFLIAVEEMRGAVAARDEATRKIIQPMEKWFDNTTPEQVKRFNDIVYSREYGSTIFQVDPKLSVSEARKKYQGKLDKSSNDLWAIWQKNHEQWKKLDSEGRRTYENMEKFYRDQHKALKDVLFARIDDTMGKTQEAKNLKDEITKRLVDKADLAVYFPLMREGRYKVGYRYKDGKTPKGQDSYVFEMYQSRSEWLARIEDIESNPDMEVTKSGEGDLDLGYAQKAPPTSFVNQTLKLLEGSGVDAKTQEAFMRMVIESLPETSFAKSLQPRENIAGHETDALRAIKVKGFSLGQQIERLGFNAKVQQLEAEVGEVPALSPKKQYILKELKDDLVKRMEFSTSGAKYKEFEGVVRVANQLAFVGTIGLNTASAMVNTSQIPLFVLPMLGGEHGYRASASAISDAASLVTGARHQAPKKGDDKGLRDRVQEALDASSPAYGLDAYYTEVNGNYTVRTDMDLPAERIKELKEIAPLVQRAAKRGHLNRSYMMDVLGLIEGGKARPNESLVRKGLSVLDRGTAISAMMFNQAERFNRQVAMVASYKLAIKKLEKEQPKLTKAEREDLAIETAFKQTHEFNGGSTLETAPRIAQENIGRVAMMYKSYGLRMYATMIKTAKQALDVYKAELKENGFSDAVAATMTSTAGKQLLGIHGTAVFFAGVHGVPLYGAVQLLADTLFLGDEEDDFNTIVRDYIGEGWYKGAVNQLTGADVASRIRLTGLVLQTNRYNTDASMEETIGFYLGGPAWSVTKRAGRGLNDMWEGEFQRGVENLLPVGVANAYKVLGRYQQDGGVYSRRGDPIYDDITGGELAAQFFGFAPAEYTRLQENNQRIKRIDTTLSRRASKLRKQYYLATRQGDFPEAREVMREIAKYNRAHPNFAITQESIDRSMKQHMKTSTEMYNGVTLSPAMRRLLNDQLEAERNGFVAPK
tara:strand:+ start:1531 stop:8238 length:6708 start_codon:yes stop_codon:yes gene_type:complete